MSQWVKRVFGISSIVCGAFSFALSESSQSSCYWRSHRIFFSLRAIHSSTVVRISYWLTAAVACAIFANHKTVIETKIRVYVLYIFVSTIEMWHALAQLPKRALENASNAFERTAQIELQTLKIQRQRLWCQIFCVSFFARVSQELPRQNRIR